MDKVNDKIEIRLALRKDIDRLLEIFALARKFMRANGNMTQWDDSYPSREQIEVDIDNGQCFVGEDTAGKVVMTFVFIMGEDPTYKVIEGQWINNEPYGTIHRIASDGSHSRIVERACDFGFGLTQNIRIDTHEDNHPMQNALNRMDFKKCGIIICRNGTPRIAFQKKK